MSKNIIKITFPNTLGDNNEESFNYSVGVNCEGIKKIIKNGEMATINWFQIIKDGEVMAEIKESVCNIFYDTSNKLCDCELCKGKFLAVDPIDCECTECIVGEYRPAIDKEDYEKHNPRLDR